MQSIISRFLNTSRFFFTFPKRTVSFPMTCCSVFVSMMVGVRTSFSETSIPSKRPVFPTLRKPISPTLCLIFRASFTVLVRTRIRILDAFGLFKIRMASSTGLIRDLIPPGTAIFSAIFWVLSLAASSFATTIPCTASCLVQVMATCPWIRRSSTRSAVIFAVELS